GTSFTRGSEQTYAAREVKARQTAAAGNLSAVGSNAQTWQEDSTVATPSIALNSDSGTAGDHITNDNQVNVTLAADVASWAYSLRSEERREGEGGSSFNLASDEN